MKPLREPKPETVQASQWFTRRRAGELDAAEAQAFEVWLQESPSHQAAFKSVERIWLLMNQVEDDDALIKVRDHDEGVLEDRGRRRTAAIAAIVLLAAGGAGWFGVQSGRLQFSAFSPAPLQKFSTSVGQQATTTLADGSVVTLDTDSAIGVRLTDGKRLVELERGRAFFKVAKDKSRPFVVSAAGKTVRATGTAFDVRTDAGRFEVTLLEGRVEVREAGGARKGMPGADLRQGWRLAVGEDARWRMEPVDLIQATAWHDGMLVFHDEPIAQAVAEMNRYSRRKVVLSGKPPETFVLGQFQAGDVDSFTRALELNRSARIVRRTEFEIEIAAR